jgi:hypothetical protein
MRKESWKAGAIARLALELALATFTMWLVVQNALILALEPWKPAPPALLVLGSLIKVSASLVAALWPWVVAALVAASVLIVALTRRVPVRKEVRHG